MNSKNIRIAMIIAPRGFQDTEFNIPYEYFKNHGAIVDVYSTKVGIAHGSMGITFNIEDKHALEYLDVKNYDAIVFVGGPGTPIVRKDDNSERVAKDAFDFGKILGAICWSPTILAKAELLKDKNVTVWDGEDDELGMLTSEYLESKGANYTAEDVTVDGKIITANGPRAAQGYAEAIWKMLVTL